MIKKCVFKCVSGKDGKHCFKFIYLSLLVGKSTRTWMWRSKDNFVEPAFSYHLCLYSGDLTEVTKLVWQVSLPSDLSCPPAAFGKVFSTASSLCRVVVLIKTLCMWKKEDHLHELVLSSTVGSGVKPRSGIWGNWFYTLCHFPSPIGQDVLSQVVKVEKIPIM